MAWKTSGIVPMLTIMEGWDHRDLRATSERGPERHSKHTRGIMVPGEKDAWVFKRTDP